MCTTENESNGQKSPINDGENKKMEIEITRYKGLVNAFNTPTVLAKLIIVISLIIVLVFFGISVIALVVKSYYPYKTVNSNEYGATIIQNEDNEVIYWLFNTADLWANSGIHVKKGDVISVRASGAFHSSIHHLVIDAEKNRKGRNWLTPIGGPNTSGPIEEPREKPRASYRISQAHPFNTLLMQVIPEDVELKDNDDNWTTKYACYMDGRPKEIKNNNNTVDHAKSIYPDIYAIGSERDKITIRCDGILYFAVNDIALTRNVIVQMKDEVKIDSERKIDVGPLKIGHFPLPGVKDREMLERDTDIIFMGLKKMGYKGGCSDTINFSEELEKKWKWDNSYRELYNRMKHYSPDNSNYFLEHYSELDYYLITNFVDAWFVDNAGSYLIVIERKKQ